MIFILSSKIKEDLLQQQITFSSEDTILVLPVCTMPKYVSNDIEWEQYFGEGGRLNHRITSILQQAGAISERVFFYNYLSDSNVTLSDYSCIILPGGDAELGIDRLMKSGLDRQLAVYSGTIIAYSAGALILLDKYFLSPNYYYKMFSIHQGLGILHADFALEVHYDFTEKMRSYVLCAINELNCPVYAIGDSGAMKFDSQNCSIELIGDVALFDQPSNEQFKLIED